MCLEVKLFHGLCRKEQQLAPESPSQDQQNTAKGVCLTCDLLWRICKIGYSDYHQEIKATKPSVPLTEISGIMPTACTFMSAPNLFLIANLLLHKITQSFVAV